MSTTHDKDTISTRAWRRRLILPAAATLALVAALLGAAPAHAGGGYCNIRYLVNYDGSPDWPATPVGPATYKSCSLAPSIARYSGGTIIAATDSDAAPPPGTPKKSPGREP